MWDVHVHMMFRFVPTTAGRPHKLLKSLPMRLPLVIHGQHLAGLRFGVLLFAGSISLAIGWKSSIIPELAHAWFARNRHCTHKGQHTLLSASLTDLRRRFAPIVATRATTALLLSASRCLQFRIRSLLRLWRC